MNEVSAHIFNRGRYSIRNMNQQLTICKQMLQTWCTNLFIFLQCCVKTGILFAQKAFMKYSHNLNIRLVQNLH